MRALQPFVDLMLMHDKSIANYILDNTAATEADSIAKAFVFIHEDDGQVRKRGWSGVGCWLPAMGEPWTRRT